MGIILGETKTRRYAARLDAKSRAAAPYGQGRAFLQALLTLMNRFGDQQATHRKIFVQPRPVDPNAAPNKAPVAQGFGAGIAQLREPLERHADGTTVFEIDDEITFDYLYAKSSGLLRCRNTHAISP